MSIFQAKIKSKALKIHQKSVDSLEYTVQFPARKKIGVTFRRHNEWGVVKVVPTGSKIIIGSLLAAVNGKSVLLEKFDDAIGRAAEALTSGKPFNLTFLAPYRLEGVLKKYEMRRMAKGWKTYYFCLNSGVLQCYAKKGGKLKEEWDLSNETQHQTLLTLAPRNLLQEGELGLMVVKGNDKIILKAEDNIRTQNWGAFLYLAIVIANGGNPDMYALEAKRLKAREPEALPQKAFIDVDAAEKAAKAQHEMAAKATAKVNKISANAELLQKAAQKAQTDEERQEIEQQEKIAEEKADEAKRELEQEVEEEKKAQAVSRRVSQHMTADMAQAAQLAAEEAERAEKYDSLMTVVVADETDADVDEVDQLPQEESTAIAEGNEEEDEEKQETPSPTTDDVAPLPLPAETEPAPLPEPEEAAPLPIPEPEVAEPTPEPVALPEPTPEPEETVALPEPTPEEPEEPVALPEPTPEEPVALPEPTPEPEEPAALPEPTSEPEKPAALPEPTPEPTPEPEEPSQEEEPEAEQEVEQPTFSPEIEFVDDDDNQSVVSVEDLNEDEKEYREFVHISGKAEEQAAEEAVEEMERQLAAMNASADDNVEDYDFDREEEVSSFASMVAQQASLKLQTTAPEVVPAEDEQPKPRAGEPVFPPDAMNKDPSELSEEEAAALAAYAEFRFGGSGSGSIAVVASDKGVPVRPQRHERGRKSLFQKWEAHAKKTMEEVSTPKRPSLEEYKPRVIKTRDDKAWMASL